MILSVRAATCDKEKFRSGYSQYGGLRYQEVVPWLVNPIFVCQGAAAGEEWW